MSYFHEKGNAMSRFERYAAKPDCVPCRRARAPRLLIVLLCGLAGCMSATTAPTMAGQARLVTGIFGSAGSVPADPYPLSSVSGVAVDLETHDVYVVDQKSHRVEKFDAAGNFILMFGKEVDRTTGGDVCTALSGDVCQAGIASSAAGGFEQPQFVAVDNSGVLGQQGDVYVSDREAGLVSKFDSEGVLISSWGNNGEGHAKNGPPNGQLNGSNAAGSVTGPFVTGYLQGIAVDPSGNLWVNGNSRDMFEFGPDSNFLTGWRPALGSIEGEEAGIAADSEDNIYLGSVAYKFGSVGTVLGAVAREVVGGLTVDPVSNELYAAERGDREPNVIARYDSSCRPGFGGCTPAESFRSNHIQAGGGGEMAIAIDHSVSADTLYVAEKARGSESWESEGPARVLAFTPKIVPDVLTSRAAGFTAGSATLAGSVNPSGIELVNGVAGCRFEWGEHGVGEAEAYGHSAPCEKTAAQIGSGSSPVEVHATITGLQQGKVYHFRLVAGNHNQVNELIDDPSAGVDLAFGPPSIESVSATSVGSGSATVMAQVNPDNVSTRVRVEYGTEADAHTDSTPELDIGSGGTGQPVPIQLLGLAAHTEYHYRMVAENALGEETQAVLSPDHVFVTQMTTTGFVLPDGRGWEMVSPPDKQGAELSGVGFEQIVEASAAGDAITYKANAPTESEPAGNHSEVQVLSRRTGTGWVTRDISPRHNSAVGAIVGFGGEYRVFSPDLSLAVVQMIGDFVPELSPEASEQAPYLRTVYSMDGGGSPCIKSCYRPLVTAATGYENVPPETVFAPTCHTKVVCGPVFVGASVDLSHVVLTSKVPLIEGAPAGAKESWDGSLYEWSDGKLALVSVLPPNGKGEELPASASVSLPELGSGSGVIKNAVSADGSRVVWTTGGENLYVRDMVRGSSVQIGSSGARFQLASNDGSKIVFKEGANLRECALVESEGELRCEVSDINPVDSGENASVVGQVAGASGDGSYVYFVSDSVLKNGGVAVPGAQPGGCAASQSASTTCNLYMWHNGQIKLVAVLSGGDSNDWKLASNLTARVSSNGRWLAFMSDRPLTGYDSHDSASGEPDEEVFLYDAAAGDGAGSLVCASCDPTGARPHGLFDRATVGDFSLVDGQAAWAGRWIAANVPGWTTYNGIGDRALYQSRYLSNGGRLFFNSSDALVPQDSNGREDVYEYEPVGAGDCAASSATFVESAGGCIGLISSGTSKEESAFMDAGEDGSDVFFLTQAQLSHSDTDSTWDVYDARVGGGFAEPSAPPVCEGDACQSPVSAPEDPTPGSLTYSGPGNPGPLSFGAVAGKQKAKLLSRAQKLARALSACKRVRSRRARGECMRRARERYGQQQIRAGRARAKKGRG